jgi:glycerophosphoryl diester phosphodiesterase
MKTVIKYCLLILVLFLTSCYKDYSSLEIPSNGSLGTLVGTTPLPHSKLMKIEGIYTAQSPILGNTVVLKSSEKHLSVFASKNESYMVLELGVKDSSILMEGYWRFASSQETGLVTMSISSENGAREILHGTTPTSIIINGFYGNGNEYPQSKFSLTYSKPLTKNSDHYWIIAHRGGGRNADFLPASENSLGIIEYVECLGANAIEIDVRLTKDNVPVLFHDDIMSQRLINEDYFIGKISDYTFAQLRSFCTLKDGERIPTLEEALETVVYKTDLKLVWIDTKTVGMLDQLVALQQKYVALAAQNGKTLEILIGIPDTDIYNDVANCSNPENIATLCELDENYVTPIHAKVWAPRWSLGLLDERVSAMHNNGYRCFVWTLDETELIRSFVKKSDFDGIVTNYPSIVAYEYYTSE